MKPPEKRPHAVTRADFQVDQMKKQIQSKGRIVSAANTGSAAGSIASAHNVCHALCLGAVALLSVFGIVVASDALMWLEVFNWPFWLMGISFLLISLALYSRYGPCISWRMMIVNAGLLVVAIPFAQNLGYLSWLAWAPGIAITVFGISLILKSRLQNKKRWFYGT